MTSASLRSASPNVVISVVIPCFNEEEVIVETHSRLLSELGRQDDFPRRW